MITVTCMYLLQIRFSLVNDIFIPVYRYEYMHCMIIPFKVEICFHYTSNLVSSHSTLSLLSSKSPPPPPELEHNCLYHMVQCSACPLFCFDDLALKIFVLTPFRFLRILFWTFIEVKRTTQYGGGWIWGVLLCIRRINRTTFHMSFTGTSDIRGRIYNSLAGSIIVQVQV